MYTDVRRKGKRDRDHEALQESNPAVYVSYIYIYIYICVPQHMLEYNGRWYIKTHNIAVMMKWKRKCTDHIVIMIFILPCWFEIPVTHIELQVNNWIMWYAFNIFKLKKKKKKKFTVEKKIFCLTFFFAFASPFFLRRWIYNFHGRKRRTNYSLTAYQLSQLQRARALNLRLTCFPLTNKNWDCLWASEVYAEIDAG